MKYVLRTWGQLKRALEVLALDEMCFQGMGSFQKGGLRFWHWVKYVFEGMGAVEKGVGDVGMG